jgi:hypothetical protein
MKAIHLGLVNSRKRIMGHIVDLMFVQKLLSEHPWRIRDNFIHPSVSEIMQDGVLGTTIENRLAKDTLLD